MKGSDFVQGIISKIESMNKSVIAFAYTNGNVTGTHKWWEICIDDYDMYSKDTRYKTLKNAWHKAARARNIKLLFCYRKPDEKMLTKLMEENSLLMNV